MAEIPRLSICQHSLLCPETAFTAIAKSRYKGGGGRAREYLQRRRPPAQTNCPPSAAPPRQDPTFPSTSPLKKTPFNIRASPHSLEWNIHIDTVPHPGVPTSTHRTPSPATHSGPNGPPPQSRLRISTARTTTLTQFRTPQFLRRGSGGGEGGYIPPHCDQPAATQLLPKAHRCPHPRSTP